MNQESGNRHLRELLRSADPARTTRELAPEELAEIRRRVLAAAGSPERRAAFVLLRPAVPVALALAIAALGLLWLRRPAPDVPTLPASLERLDTRLADSTSSGLEERRRQLFFATREGTRIVWVLYDDLPRDPARAYTDQGEPR